MNDIALIYEFLTGLVRRDLDIDTKDKDVKDNVDYYLEVLEPYLNLIERYNLPILYQALEHHAKDIEFLLEERKKRKNSQNS